MITDAFSEIRSTLPSINMKRNKNQTEFSTNVSTDKSQYFPTPEPSKLKKLKKSNLKQKT